MFLIGLVLMAAVYADRMFTDLKGFTLFDRFVVMKDGLMFGTAQSGQISKDEALAMIILGTRPPAMEPRPGVHLRIPEQPKEGKP